ncbi:MAG TPA: hypothetical protein VMF58_05885 [Rhizomicrobium sp.]|nr:hypothetical protein [Rhizomicrobium sp.]
MLRFNSSHFLAGICFAGALAATPALADGHTLSNSRLSITFGSSLNGYGTTDSDRVDAISWINSDGATVSNYVTSGGPMHCGDPQEFFGEAYGDNGDEGVPLPHAVTPGVTSKWKGAKPTAGKTTISSLETCDDTLDAKTTTNYQIYGKKQAVNSMRIIRTFKFSRKTSTGNMRVYVPRLPLGTYATVLAPNAAGVIQSYNVGNCPLNCTITDWNGNWMADDDGHGNGMVIFRDPDTNPPAQLTIDYDGYSNSNNSAVTLTMPVDGWAGTVSDTEYLCFYDAKSWPAAKRNAGKLPAGCTNAPK